MRTFETGATRDSDEDKLDYEGFLSPIALEAFAAYMHKHQFQADGQRRESDNWQLGLPAAQTMKSLWRHVIDLWAIHRGWRQGDPVEAACACWFNTQAMLHELLREQHGGTPGQKQGPYA